MGVVELWLHYYNNILIINQYIHGYIHGYIDRCIDEYIDGWCILMIMFIDSIVNA